MRARQSRWSCLLPTTRHENRTVGCRPTKILLFYFFTKNRRFWRSHPLPATPVHYPTGDRNTLQNMAFEAAEATLAGVSRNDGLESLPHRQNLAQVRRFRKPVVSLESVHQVSWKPLFAGGIFVLIIVVITFNIVLDDERKNIRARQDPATRLAGRS